MPIDTQTNLPVPTPPGAMPAIRNLDLKTQVQMHVDLNAPVVEYVFSNGRTFKRMPGQTGLYNE